MSEQELKDAWKRDGSRLNMTTDMATRMIYNQKTTALERLAERYKRFSILGIVFAILGFLTGLNPHILDVKYRMVYIIWYCGLMLACAVIDRYLYMKVSGINVYTMPTAEVIKRAIQCRRLHLRSMCFLIPIALGFIGFIIWIFSDEEYVVYGIGCGFIIGLTIGLFKLAEFMRDYRYLSEDEPDND
ncbi:MAG: hypothetical protein HDR88_07080 [Bacteroides sp.]|nr:hypothetical protein [Bacteroides sp.]